MLCYVCSTGTCFCRWDVNTTDPRQLRDHLIRRNWVEADPMNVDRRTREALVAYKGYSGM